MRSRRTTRSLARRLTLSSLVLCAFVSRVQAQEPTDAFNQQLARLSALNSLDATGVPPWHMRVSYTRFDTKEGVSGSLELWSLGRDETRVELTEPDRKGVYLLLAAGRLRSVDSKLLPQDLVFLLQDLMHPFPAPQIFEVAKTEDADFGALRTNCLLERPQSVSRNPDESLGNLPSFCVDQADVLRVAWFQSGVKAVNDRSESFQEHRYPQIVKISFRDRQMLEAKVDTLESWKGTVDFASDNFVPDVFTGPVRISGGILQANRLTSVSPHYPESAKQDRLSGTVVLSIKVGMDGSVQDLSVVSAPRDDLATAAMEAVRQWTYKPYILNGAPVQLNSTVTVNFNLAP